MTREHPMLMKGPLVRATLAGRKTQARRLVTPQNSTVHGWPNPRSAWPLLDWSRALPGTMVQPGGPPVPLWRVPLRDAPERDQDARVMILPRVRPGDALWVYGWEPVG